MNVSNAPDGAKFYEVWDVFEEVDGEERTHKNADLAFDTEAKAQAWIDKKRQQAVYSE